MGIRAVLQSYSWVQTKSHHCKELRISAIVILQVHSEFPVVLPHQRLWDKQAGGRQP